MSIIAHPPGPARLAAPITRPAPAIRPPVPAAQVAQVETITVYRPASRTRVLLTYGTGGLLIESVIYTVTASTAGPAVAVILTGTGAGLAGIVGAVAAFASWSTNRQSIAAEAGIADAYATRPGVQ